MLIAAVLILCCAAGLSLADAVRHHDTPADDTAVVVRSSQTAFSDLPLLGPGSSAGYYGNGPSSHPGPLLFYAAAPFIDVLGSQYGSFAFAALLNTGCILLAGLSGWRRARARGAMAMLVGGAVAVALAIPGQFLDIHITYMGALPLFASLALGWSVAEGDWLMLPLLAVTASFATQTETAFVVPLLPVVVIVPLFGLWTTRRERRPLRPVVVATAGTAVLSVALWLPPIYDQISDTHNMTRLLQASIPTRGLHGLSLAWGTMLHGPPLPGVTQYLLFDGLHPLGLRSLVVAALVAVMLWVRREEVARFRGLFVVASAALLGAGLAGRSLPLGDLNPQHLIWLRATWVFVWVAVGLVFVPVALAALQRAVVFPQLAQVVALGVSLIVLVSATYAGTRPERYRGSAGPVRTINRLVSELTTRLPAHQDTVISSNGVNAWSVAPGLAPRLQDEGHPTRYNVPPDETTQVQLVLTRSGRPAPSGGTLVATSPGEPARPGLPAAVERVARWVRAHGPLSLSATGRGNLPEVVDGIAPTICIPDLRDHPAKLLALGGPELLLSLYAMGFVLAPTLPPDLAQVTQDWSSHLGFEVWRLPTPRKPVDDLLLSRPRC